MSVYTNECLNRIATSLEKLIVIHKEELELAKENKKLLDNIEWSM